MPEKIKKYLKHPDLLFRNILPYLAIKFADQERTFLEFFGNESLSKPYTAHEALLEKIPEENGFFVEVGGNDGYFQDPTYYLEKFRGWTGIIIEPLPTAAACQKNRRRSVVVRAAMVPFGYSEKTITLTACDKMSVIKNGVEGYTEWVQDAEHGQNIYAEDIEVPARKLNDVLDEYFSTHPKRQIDLMTMDTEGYELNVLKGLDLDACRPTRLLIEIHTPERRAEIERHLGNRYHLVGQIVQKDYLYERVERL